MEELPIALFHFLHLPSKPFGESVQQRLRGRQLHIEKAWIEPPSKKIALLRKDGRSNKWTPLLQYHFWGAIADSFGSKF